MITHRMNKKRKWGAWVSAQGATHSTRNRLFLILVTKRWTCSFYPKKNKKWRRCFGWRWTRSGWINRSIESRLLRRLWRRGSRRSNKRLRRHQMRTKQSQAQSWGKQSTRMSWKSYWETSQQQRKCLWRSTRYSMRSLGVLRTRFDMTKLEFRAVIDKL